MKKIKINEEDEYLKYKKKMEIKNEKIVFRFGNEQIMKEFKKKKKIIKLSFEKIKISDFKQIKEEIDKRKDLIELDLSNNIFGEEELYYLSEIILKENKNIKVLNYKDSFIENSEFLLFGQLENDNVVQELNLSNQKYRHEYKYVNFYSLSKIKILKKLNLYGNKLNLSNIIDLLNNLKLNKSIKYLDLSLNDIENEGIKYIFNFLKNNEVLENLILQNVINDDKKNEEIIEIEEYFKNSNNSLIELDLTGNYIKSNIVKNLSNGLKNNSKLKILSLSSNSIRNYQKNDGIKYLIDLVKYNNSITNLDISNNVIEFDEFVKIMNEINNNNIIEELDVNEVLFCEEDIEEELYIKLLNDFFFKNKIKKLIIGGNLDSSFNGYYLNSFKIENNNNSIEELYLNKLFNYNGLFNFLNESIYYFNELKKIQIRINTKNLKMDEKITNLIYYYLENSSKLNYFEFRYMYGNKPNIDFDLLKILEIFDKKNNLNEIKFDNTINLELIKNISKIENYFLNIEINGYGIHKRETHVDNNKIKFKDFKTDEYFNLNFIYKKY